MLRFDEGGEVKESNIILSSVVLLKWQVLELLFSSIAGGISSILLQSLPVYIAFSQQFFWVTVILIITKASNLKSYTSLMWQDSTNVFFSPIKLTSYKTLKHSTDQYECIHIQGVQHRHDILALGTCTKLIKNWNKQ